MNAYPTWSEMLTQLKESGISDSQVARELTERGIRVSQPTITRIRNGHIKSPLYELGDGLRSLYAQHIARVPKRRLMASGTRHKARGHS